MCYQAFPPALILRMFMNNKQCSLNNKQCSLPLPFSLIAGAQATQVCIWTSQCSQCCVRPTTCASNLRTRVEPLRFTQVTFLVLTLIHQVQDFHTGQKITRRARDPQPQRQIFKQCCISLYFPSYCPSLSLKKRTPNQCHLLMTPMHRVDVAWALAEARTHQKAAAQHSSSISWADLSARCFILTPERLLDLVSQLNTNHLGVFQMSARRSYEIKPVFIRYSRSTRENLQIKKLSGLWCRPFWSWGAAVAA